MGDYGQAQLPGQPVAPTPGVDNAGRFQKAPGGRHASDTPAAKRNLPRMARLQDDRSATARLVQQDRIQLGPPRLKAKPRAALVGAKRLEPAHPVTQHPVAAVALKAGLVRATGYT